MFIILDDRDLSCYLCLVGFAMQLAKNLSFSAMLTWFHKASHWIEPLPDCVWIFTTPLSTAIETVARSRLVIQLFRASLGAVKCLGLVVQN